MSTPSTPEEPSTPEGPASDDTLPAYRPLSETETDADADADTEPSEPGEDDAAGPDDAQPAPSPGSELAERTLMLEPAPTQYQPVSTSYLSATALQPIEPDQPDTEPDPEPEPVQIETRALTDEPRTPYSDPAPALDPAPPYETAPPYNPAPPYSPVRPYESAPPYDPAAPAFGAPVPPAGARGITAPTDTPGTPWQIPATDPDAGALDRPARVRMRTVVFGLVLLVIAGSVLVGQLTSVTVDAGAVFLALMIGGGVLLIAGARRS